MVKDREVVPCNMRQCANNICGVCLALTECLEPNCRFYKTKEQNEWEKQQCRERLKKTKE